MSIKITAELDNVHGFTEGETVAVIIKGVQYILVCHIDGEDYLLEKE
jgi:hypothetical protein